MGQCIDRALFVDASRSRSRLGWAPKQRLEIVRRMPFLVHNRRTRVEEWLRRNHVAPRRVRLRSGTRIEALLAAREDRICSRLEEVLQAPARRRRFPAYLGCSRDHLEERHRHLLEQLLCAIRTGDKGVFMSSCRHLAEQWHEHDLPPEELTGALECLDEVCLETVRDAPEAEELGQALRDHISMTIQFGVDMVHEVSERHARPRVRAPVTD